MLSRLKLDVLCVTWRNVYKFDAGHNILTFPELVFTPQLFIRIIIITISSRVAT